MSHYEPKQKPFPVVYVAWRGGSKTQMGVIHVAGLRDVPVIGDEITLKRVSDETTDYHGVAPYHGEVAQRRIHYKPAAPNEAAIIEYIEVFV